MSDCDMEYYLLSDSEINDELDFEENEPNKRIDTTERDSSDYEAKCGDILVSNRGNYTFVCEFCSGRYKDIESFGNHLKDVHLNYDVDDASAVGSVTELKIEIGYTDKSVHTRPIEILEEELECSDHYLTPTLPPGDSDLYCKPCNRQFKAKSSFSRHKNRHKYKLVAEDSTTEVSIDSPINQIEGGQYFCSLCRRYFKTKKTFRDHATSRHGNEIPEALRDDPTYLSCKFCHMKFDTVLGRVDHESTHGEEKPFRCASCPKTFRLKSQRDLHDHTHTGAHPYPCPYCPKAFTSHINRLQHIRGHLGIKRFSCEFCDKKFITNVQRSIHVRIHTHEKPYQCEQCGERFRVSGQLFSHRKRHANKRDCQCDVCGKSFFSNDAVKNHRAGHFAERPFECTVCGKRFQRKKTLTAHQKLHGPEKKYECKICGKRFAQCAGLHAHRKTHGAKLSPTQCV